MRARGIEPSEEGAVPALARVTGLDTRYLYRWYNGEARPNADNTIDLLQRAGLLKWDDAVPPPSARSEDDEAARRYDELRDSLEEVKEAVRDLTATVRDLQARTG